MDRTKLPGYQPQLRVEQEGDPLSLEARLRAAALNPEGHIDEIDPEELERAPLFEFEPLVESDGYVGGFESRPAPGKGARLEVAGLKSDSLIKNPEDIASASYGRAKYERGKAIDAAPMSQEQLRLLLYGVIPPELMAFTMDRIVFQYEDKRDDENAPAARIVVKKQKGRDGVLRDKIHLVLNHSAFITRGKGRGKEVTGFVDPSRIVLIIGRVFGKMIEPPPDWNTRVPHYFRVTRPQRASRRDLATQNSQDQWEMFVGLCLASPETAKTFSPTSYQYFKEASQNFTDASVHSAYVGKIASLSEQDKTIPNFQLDLDLRTRQEKEKAKDPDDPASYDPELYWFDRAFTGANKILKFFRLRLTYELPDDPDRAFQTANDANEVKKLLERTRQVDRDKMYGKLMQLARLDNVEDKARARQLLMASSQSEDWNEWREIVYLYKFSPVFRASDGQRISKDDFEDLRTIHNMSAQQGKRYGTDMVPYDMVPVPDPTDTSGRTMVIEYRRKEQAAWIKEVEHKIEEKGDRVIQGVGISVFDLFYPSEGKGKPIDPSRLEAIYDPKAPGGLDNTYGRLDALLGEGLANTIVKDYLIPLKVRQVPPDALIILQRLYRVALETGKEGQLRIGEHMPRQAQLLFKAYGDRLAIAPTAEIEDFKSLTERLTQESSPQDVAQVLAQGNKLKGEMIEKIMSQAEPPETRAGQEAPRVSLDFESRNILQELLAEGRTTINDILPEFERKTWSFLAPLVQRGEDPTSELDQRRGNLIHFLTRVKSDLAALDEIVEYEARIKPPTVDFLNRANAELASSPDVLTAGSVFIHEEELETLDKAGITKKEDREGWVNQTMEREIARAAQMLLHPNIEEAIKEDTREQIKERLAKIIPIDLAFKAQESKLPSLTAEERKSFLAQRQEFVDGERKELIAQISGYAARIKADDPIVTRGSEETRVTTSINTILGAVAGEQVSYVKRQLAEVEPEAREKLILELMDKALYGKKGSLDAYLANDSLGTYSRRFERWVKGPGKIFNLSSAKKAKEELAYSVRLMDRGLLEEGLNAQGKALKSLIQIHTYAKEEMQAAEKAEKEKKAA